MHILGKILAVLVAGGALATVILTTKLLHARTAWIKSVEDKKQAYLAVKDEPAKRKVELAKHQFEYQLANYNWGKVFSNVVANEQAGGTGVLINGVGAAEGLRPGQMIHLFRPDGNQGTVYVGPFRIENVADGQTAASFTWIVRPVDRATFGFGQQGFRVREMISNSDLENFVQSQHAMSLKDIELKDAKKWLDLALNRDRKTAEDQLQFRINELHGDPAQADKKGILPDQFVDGLVVAIENSEEARNVTLEEVHELRQKLQDVYDEVVDLQKKNDGLIQALPGNAPIKSALKDETFGG